MKKKIVEATVYLLERLREAFVEAWGNSEEEHELFSKYNIPSKLKEEIIIGLRVPLEKVGEGAINIFLKAKRQGLDEIGEKLRSFSIPTIVSLLKYSFYKNRLDLIRLIVGILEDNDIRFEIREWKELIKYYEKFPLVDDNIIDLIAGELTGRRRKTRSIPLGSFWGRGKK